MTYIAQSVDIGQYAGHFFCIKGETYIMSDMKLVSKEYLREIKNNNAFLNMILIAIENIFDGNEPSDFEMSFDIVRRVMEMKIELEHYRQRND